MEQVDCSEEGLEEVPPLHLGNDHLSGLDQLVKSEGVALANEHTLTLEHTDIGHDWLDNASQLLFELTPVLHPVDKPQVLELLVETPKDTMSTLLLKSKRDLDTKHCVALVCPGCFVN